MNEEWKYVEGYEGLYEVSNLGRVKSLFDGCHKIFREKILKPGTNKKGYLLISLCKEGKEKRFSVHRLVAMAFLENPSNLPDVNHKNEDKKNNRVENLEWTSHKDNCNYGTRNFRVAEKNTNGKLSKPVLQFTKNGEFVKEWPSTMECERNGFNSSHISKCCNGKLKYHAGFIWKYSSSNDQE